MQCLDQAVVHMLRPPGDGPLLSLGDGFASRFHSWHGLSGRRYVFSVFSAAAGVPSFEPCVLMAVAHEGAARRTLGLVVVERGTDRRLLEGLAARGCDEWHVHLIADDRRARAAVATDLRARHIGGAVALA